MTTKRILYTHPTDGVVRITPAPRERREDESEEDFLQRVIDRMIETAAQKDRRGNVVNPYLTAETKFTIVEADDLPPQEARASWKIVGDKVVAS